MKVIVVEDSRLAREGLVKMLGKFPELEVVGEADHPSSARKLIEETNPDVIFLDIHMPGESGFEMLDNLEYSPRIIFTTAYSEYAIQAFNYYTVDYLLKPVSHERLAKAVSKLMLGVKHNIDTDASDDREDEGLAKPRLDINSRIFIKDGEKCHLINVDSIRYIETCKNYVLIFFGDKKAYVKKTLNDMEARLPEHHFFRISRQQIVNLQAISKIEESIGDGYNVTLTDGKILEVSRRNAAQLKELLSF